MRKAKQNKSVRRAYTLGLVLICVLVTLQFAGVRLATLRQEVSAIEINLSGRQRMLSQRVAWTMYRLASADGPQLWEDDAQLRTLLAVCVALMERSHVALQGRDLDEMRGVLNAGGPCLTPDFSRLTLPQEPRVVIEEADRLVAFTDQAWTYATGDPRESDLPALIRFADGPLVDLLTELDQATFAAQEASTQQLQRLLVLNWVLILALILAEVALIFRPMAAAVERSVAGLRKTNSKLRKSEARVMDFAGTAAHQFWETDAEHRLIWVGAPNADIQLYDPDANLGMRPWDIAGLVKDDADPPLDRLIDMMNRHVPFRAFAFAAETADGQRFWWHAHGRPVFDKDGVFVGYRGTAREITAERETAERLRVAERMQALGKLTAGVAHDFNNILAVVQGYAELLPMEPNSAQQKEAVAEIVAASKRGASLTSQLLSFGRVQRLRAEPIELGAFLKRLEALLNRTLGEEFEINATVPARAIAVLCDRHQLEDACLNIASNARDACAPGGRLWIDAHPVPAPDTLDLSEAPLHPDGYVCLTFRDNGSGMSDRTAKRVFEPFYTTKPVGEGTGLGLSMVYGFAQQSNGAVSLESRLGVGTTIRLYLPRSFGAGAEQPDPEVEEQPSAAGQSALLVEDNAALRRLTRRHLEELGFAVTEAIDGGSALEQIADKGPFDLLLLDIVLPGGIDGVDVARRAKQTDPTVAVIFCSGFVDRETWTRGPELAEEAMLRKPYPIDLLTATVEEVMTRRQQVLAENS